MSPPLLLLLLLALSLLATASGDQELVRKKRQSGGKTVFTCNFDPYSWCGMSMCTSGYDFMWSLNSGSTPSSYTGPSCDHTSCRGYYAYTEASSPRQWNDKAGFLLPMPGSRHRTKCLSFYLHMYGDSMGSLEIDLSNYTYPDSSDRRILFESGNKYSVWFRRDITIPRDTAEQYIVFVGRIGSSYTGDMAIDDITVTEGATCSGVPDPPICSLSPCNNGGSCIEDLNSNEGFYCTCPTGFQGQTCDEDVDECMNGPCLNSGSCSNYYGGYSCTCPVGYSGTHCEIELPMQKVRKALEDARAEAWKSQTEADEALRHLRTAWAEADALKRRR